MVFTDFKLLDQVQTAYRIKYLEEDFINLVSLSPPEQFILEYEFSKNNFDIFSSEASRCENVIYPLLREACKRFVQRCSLWSHQAISADNLLTGTPDYIVGKRSELGKNVLEFPLILIAEAKQNDFVQGWAQCLAEMVAAQKLNGNENLVVYGIVTDAELWQFGKLEGPLFTKNHARATIDNLNTVFGSVSLLLELASN